MSRHLTSTSLCFVMRKAEVLIPTRCRGLVFDASRGTRPCFTFHVPHFDDAARATADSQLMAGTYRLTHALTTLDSDQDLRRSERRVLPLHQSSRCGLIVCIRPGRHPVDICPGQPTRTYGLSESNTHSRSEEFTAPVGHLSEPAFLWRERLSRQ